MQLKNKVEENVALSIEINLSPSFPSLSCLPLYVCLPLDVQSV